MRKNKFKTYKVGRVEVRADLKVTRKKLGTMFGRWCSEDELDELHNKLNPKKKKKDATDGAK
jgi:hypothetical protein